VDVLCRARARFGGDFHGATGSVQAKRPLFDRPRFSENWDVARVLSSVSPSILDSIHRLPLSRSSRIETRLVNYQARFADLLAGKWPVFGGSDDPPVS